MKNEEEEWLFGPNAVDAAVATRRAVELITTGSSNRVDRLVERAKKLRFVKVRQAARGELDRLAKGRPHQGVGARIRPYEYQTLEEIVARPGPIVLLDGVNDSLEDAARLMVLLRGLRPKIKLNLIPFNPWPGAPYSRPDSERVSEFGRMIRDAHFHVTVRYSKGDDIGAACGQLDGTLAVA